METKSREKSYSKVREESTHRQNVTRQQAKVAAVYCAKLEHQYELLLRDIQEVESERDVLTESIEGILPDIHDSLIFRASVMEESALV